MTDVEIARDDLKKAGDRLNLVYPVGRRNRRITQALNHILTAIDVLDTYEMMVGEHDAEMDLKSWFEEPPKGGD